jgi:hypothetical protein
MNEAGHLGLLGLAVANLHWLAVTRMGVFCGPCLSSRSNFLVLFSTANDVEILLIRLFHKHLV